MQLEHHFTVPTGLEEAWAAFNDLERVAPCFPGATITSVDGDDFVGSCKVKLGPIALQYNGTGSFVERDESGHRAVLQAKGRDKRGNGTASATVTAQLRPDGDGTAVDVTTDLAITGKPAQFGRGVIQDVSDKLLGRFVDCLQDNLGQSATTLATTEGEPARAEGEGESQPAPPSAPPGQVPAVTPGPPPKATPSPVSAPPRDESPDAELDLWSTVAPVLAKRYAPLALAGLGGLVLGLLLGRRRRSGAGGAGD